MLFPGGRLPLRVFEQRYLEMTKACLREGTAFGVCALRQGAEVLRDGAPPAVPASVGCAARIAEWDMPQLGVLHIVASGERRFRVLEHRAEKNGLVRARVEPLADEVDVPVAAAHGRCVRLLGRLLAEAPAFAGVAHQLDSSSWVGMRLAELLPVSLESKQELLEMTDAGARLERLTALLVSARVG